MRVAVYGAGGKVGRVLVPVLEGRGYEVQVADPAECDVAIDFTRPDAVVENVSQCLRGGVPVVVGTTGWDTTEVDVLAKRCALPVFFAPNFALGAVVMIRLAAEAARWLPRSSVVEMHDESKRDAPSGTAIATAAAMGTNPEIVSVRLPGLVAHHEIIFSSPGELLTIRHDSLSRESFVSGVLLALTRIRSLPPGITIGLESLLQ